MRILVDVMGGDNAPLETVKGACDAAKEYAADYTLIGDREQIEKLCAEAREYHFKSVCVNTAMVHLASDLLKDSGVNVLFRHKTSA